MTIGVYQILNTVTGKCYVGQSSCLKTRWRDHKRSLRCGGHINPKLQKAWNKYGEVNFEFKLLQACEREKLTWLEAFWMDSLDSFNNGYNIEHLTLEDGLVVKIHSEETRKKISVGNLGKKNSPETILKMSKAKKGLLFSEEHKAKLAVARKTRVIKAETRKKISESNTGRIVSSETKKKIGEANKNASIETRKKLSAAQMGNTNKVGKKASSETKLRMQEAWVKRRLQKLEVA